MNCPHTKTHRLGFGIYCDDCKKLVHMVPEKESKKIFLDALIDDAKRMGIK